jgi:hypothetical protein
MKRNSIFCNIAKNPPKQPRCDSTVVCNKRSKDGGTDYSNLIIRTDFKTSRHTLPILK